MEWLKESHVRYKLVKFQTSYYSKLYYTLSSSLITWALSQVTFLCQSNVTFDKEVWLRQDSRDDKFHRLCEEFLVGCSGCDALNALVVLENQQEDYWNIFINSSERMTGFIPGLRLVDKGSRYNLLARWLWFLACWSHFQNIVDTRLDLTRNLSKKSMNINWMVIDRVDLEYLECKEKVYKLNFAKICKGLLVVPLFFQMRAVHSLFHFILNAQFYLSFSYNFGMSS